MFRTLEDLRDSVDRMIADQGKDAPCAAFVFTKDDVYSVDGDGDFIGRSPEETEKVLESVGDCDYVYEVIGNLIEEELRGA